MDLAKTAVEYVDKIKALLTKGNDTAAGKTADVLPEEPTQEKVRDALPTDGRDFANAVFTAGAAKTPAEMIAMADSYDTTQAVTRILALGKRTRADYYNLAASALKTRQSRLQYKQLMTVAMTNPLDSAKKAQGGEPKK